MVEVIEKQTVLIVDDVPASIKILNQILSEEYRVLFALNGETGLAVTRTKKPELILLDVSMPGMDGYQLCRELKSDPDTHDIPIIFVTDKDRDENREMAFKIGAADYITKPIEAPLVKMRVKNQLLIRHSEERILHQSLYDGLTNLPNRNLSIDRLKYMITQGARNQLKTALLFIDLDNFKEINNTLGYDTGDQILIEAAARFKECIREVDTVGRFGNDEFIIILPDLKKTDDAKKVADSIIHLFSSPLMLLAKEVVVTVSIGIAFSPNDSNEYNQLLTDANTALYQSKKIGGNTYHLFNELMNQNVKRRMTIEFHLRHALQHNEMTVFYQPLIDIVTEKIIGAEALLRWNNAELGLVPPDEFIAIAEQSGIIEEIGAFVLKQGCQHIKDLVNQDGQPLFLAVNVSPQQFRRSNLPELITNILNQTGFPPERLELEVTEGLLLDGHESIKKSLQIFRNQGIGLSMDDFGTGYSSLSYLRKFPFDVIKIDRSFVMDLVSNSSDQALITAAIAMAHALGIKIIAEGVETKSQLEFLITKKCDIAQGYLFSRPVPIDNFKQLLTTPK